MNISKYSNSCENAKVPIADLNPGRIFSCDGNLYMKIENGSEDAKCISLDSGILVYIKRNYSSALVLDLDIDTKNKKPINLADANPGDLVIIYAEPCIKSNCNTYYSLLTGKEIKCTYAHSAYIIKDTIKAYQYVKEDKLSSNESIKCVNKDGPSIQLVSPSDIPIGGIFEKDGKLMMKVRIHESDTSSRVCYLWLSTGECFTDISDKVVSCEFIGNAISYKYKRG